MRRVVGQWLDKYWRLLVTLWLIAFTVLVFLGIHTLRSNQHAIQRSRLESCHRTYTVLQELIHASVIGRKLNDTQEDRVRRFLRITDPDRCGQQIKP